MVPSQLSKLARKHQCTELKSMWHFQSWFLFRPVVSNSFQIAPILLLLQWIRMPFIIISFYFVALLRLQDNDGFSFLFDESLFPKSAAILLLLSRWHLHMQGRIFFKQIYHIPASFASYCPLSTRPNIVAHTSSSTSLLTFSSISWAWRHTSWCVAFSCSTSKGTALQLWSTFHILWHFFGWLSGDKAKSLWLFASGESKPEYGYTPYVNRTDQKGQCKKAARGN